jgi:hypothetical protein
MNKQKSAEVLLMPLFQKAILILLLISMPLLAEEWAWQGSLMDGSQITIDPSTNKAMRTQDGVSSPLWNGVHRLNNGAVIIVREGLVVRDETVIEAQQEQARNRLNAACMQLVTKVCGPHNECVSSPGCDPARQLLAMERDELNSSWSGSTLESSTLCLEALGNEQTFARCTQRDESYGASACERLVSKVCGNSGKCGQTQGCQAARQLVGMEQQDLFDTPGIPSPASAQCAEQLRQSSETFLTCLK